jgi:hypothetical protein
MASGFAPDLIYREKPARKGFAVFFPLLAVSMAAQ